MNITDTLISWFDKNHRQLPWRVVGQSHPNPYHVWLSEIMLQQTTVAAVISYFLKFTQKWPTIFDLATATEDNVLTAWAGLGYYARARNLHKCAKTLVADYNGVFPSNEEDLQTLPGIGPYTAAAITAIAFDQPSGVVDGNIERLMSRLYDIDTPLPQAKKEISAIVLENMPKQRCGDFAQAMMDFANQICLPKNPLCDRCPISHQCRAFQNKTQNLRPVKPAKKDKPTRQALIGWITNKKGQILIRKRPDKGLLASMYEFPSTEWKPTPLPKNPNKIMDKAKWKQQKIGDIKHTFTHFHLKLEVYQGHMDHLHLPENYKWVAVNDLSSYALPTVMQKVSRLIL